MSMDNVFDKIYMGLITFITFGLIITLLIITAIYIDTKRKLDGIHQCSTTLGALRQESCTWTAPPKQP